MKGQTNAHALLSRYRIEELINSIISHYSVPDNAKQLTLNLKHSHFYSLREGIQPVEIRVDRTTTKANWTVRLIATFDYPSPSAQSVDVALYFNFQSQWFYQPDIKRCDLNQPKAIALLQSWLAMFTHHLSLHHFDQQQLTITKNFN
ncbi:DUF2787 family protein [Vibrio sp. 1288]|uniref:DUF2787 family protein n=1 Tax=Vibrio sp. 1288 TaxID=3074550 RepID=UPI002967464B|nr:DUF2787 family protein [Vibrio sp. 1288]MDW3136302.1 DUF2787 family protein [Vibrio sp. 1288]